MLSSYWPAVGLHADSDPKQKHQRQGDRRVQTQGLGALLRWFIPSSYRRLSLFLYDRRIGDPVRSRAVMHALSPGLFHATEQNPEAFPKIQQDPSAK